MAKRFTDSDKWKDSWFMDLPSKYKLFWMYLLDECNHAGIWKVNFKVATFYIGEHLEHSEVKRILKDRIIVLNDEYWFINKFIKYQYKCDIEKLNMNNNAHLSVIKILDEYEIFKPLTSPLLGAKDKDKDKDKNKEVLEVEIKNEESIKIEEVEKSTYTQKQFLEDWSKCRMHFLKQPTNILKLSVFELDNFNKALKDFTAQEIKDSMVGLFKQENKTIKAMYLRPTHFLENVSKYSTAFFAKEFTLYGKDQIKTSL